jgi:Na+-driven multidrug efflux pump
MTKVKQILRIGLPASLGQSLVALGFVVLMGMIARFGTDILAAHGIGTRIINMVFIVTGGLMGASITMIGQNLGANKIRRAERILNRTILVVALFLAICSTFFFIFSQQLFSVFINERDVISYGRTFMMAFGVTIIGFGVFNSVQAAYMASGRTVPSMIMGLIRLWGLRVPLAVLFGFIIGWDAVGIWIGMGLSNILSALVALAWAATGSWKKSAVIRKTPPLREPLV